MSKKKKFIIVVLTALILTLIYFNRNSYIESISWKSFSNNRVSNFMDFKENHLQINGKSIVLKDKKYGTVILCVRKYLIVTNNDGEFCLYTNKGFKNSKVKEPEVNRVQFIGRGKKKDSVSN